jgi:plastocyanin
VAHSGVAALLACVVGVSAAHAGNVTVTIENMQFSPATVTVKRGDTVTWLNKDLVPHTATRAKAFDSRTIEPGKSWSFVPKSTGQLKYLCTLHPSMTATLVVE